MKNNNIYKPKYKLSYQAKVKVWPNKNSRLRRFFNIRGRKLVRRGLFKRFVLVHNNMKWTIARRYMRPYMRRRKPIKNTYKKIFYSKQQLRSFYGKIKEQNFIILFQKYASNASSRNNSFYAALESRLDMILFRMRILPTIHACAQLIHHQGIKVNNGILTSPNTKVLPGDIITLQEKFWDSVHNYIYERAWFRAYGFYRLRKRQYSLIKKKAWWSMKRNTAKIRGKSLIDISIKILDVYKQINKPYRTNCKKLMVKALNAKKILNNKDDVNIVIKKLFLLQRSFRFFYNKAITSIKALLNSKKKVVWWRRSNQLTMLLRQICLKYSHKKSIAFLILKLKLEELNLYKIILSEIKDEKQKETLNLLINEKKNLLINKFAIFKNKIETQVHFFLRRRLRKHMLRSFKRFKKRKSVAFSNRLIFFIRNRRYKKRRKKQIPRLKNIHWYVPSYIFMDFRSLRAVYLYNPLPKEIVYPFKISLPKIYSFYKSKGY